MYLLLLDVVYEYKILTILFSTKKFSWTYFFLTYIHLNFLANPRSCLYTYCVCNLIRLLQNVNKHLPSLSITLLFSLFFLFHFISLEGRFCESMKYFFYCFCCLFWDYFSYLAKEENRKAKQIFYSFFFFFLSNDLQLLGFNRRFLSLFLASKYLTCN